MLKTRATEKEFHRAWIFPMSGGETKDLGKPVNANFQEQIK